MVVKSKREISKKVEKEAPKTNKKEVHNVERSLTGDIPFPVIKIQNIVVSADLHATVDLYALSKEVKAIDYEPEQFPGAIFKVHDPKSALLLFKNGKIICTGAKTEEDVRRAVRHALDLIKKYRAQQKDKPKGQQR